MSANGHVVLTSDQNYQDTLSSFKTLKLSPSTSSSSSLNGIGRSVTASVETLPQTLLNKIFDCLHQSDRPPITHINHLFQNAVFLHGQTEIESVKKFISTVISKIGQQNASSLPFVYQWIDSSHAKNIVEINRTLCIARKDLLLFLQDKIKSDDFKLLIDVAYKQESPFLIRNLFELAEINIELRKTLVGDHSRGPALQQLLHRLYSIGEWNTTIATIYRLYETLREDDQKRVCEELVQALDSPAKLNSVAIAVEYKFQQFSKKRYSDQKRQSMMLMHISNKFCALGHLEKAAAIAHKIFDKDAKYKVFEKISFNWFSRHNLEKAFEAAQILPSESGDRFPALRKIDEAIEKILEEMRGLCSKYECHAAIKRADDIPCEKRKSQGLQETVVALCRQAKLEKADQVAKSISKDPYKSMALATVSQVWSAKGEVKRASEMVDNISNDHDKSKTLEALSKAWCAKGDLDKATVIADKIPSQYYQSTALQEISKACLEKGDLDKAIKIANKIPYEHQRSQAQKAIEEVRMIKSEGEDC